MTILLIWFINAHYKETQTFFNPNSNTKRYTEIHTIPLQTVPVTSGASFWLWYTHPSMPVTRQHSSCVDTHLPSSPSALNLVLIAKWMGEQADMDRMRSRLSLFLLQLLRKLRFYEASTKLGLDAVAM